VVAEVKVTLKEEAVVTKEAVVETMQINT